MTTIRLGMKGIKIMKKEPVFGMDFEKQRPRVKKDKHYLGSLSCLGEGASEEWVEKPKEEVVESKVMDFIPLLPRGYKTNDSL